MTKDELIAATALANQTYVGDSWHAEPNGRAAVVCAPGWALAESYRKDAERAQAEAVALWKLLDDIDTLDDAAKGDDLAFRNSAYKIQRKRFGVVSGERFDAISAALGTHGAGVGDGR